MKIYTRQKFQLHSLCNLLSHVFCKKIDPAVVTILKYIKTVFVLVLKMLKRLKTFVTKILLRNNKDALLMEYSQAVVFRWTCTVNSSMTVGNNNRCWTNCQHFLRKRHCSFSDVTKTSHSEKCKDKIGVEKEPNSLSIFIKKKEKHSNVYPIADELIYCCDFRQVCIYPKHLLETYSGQTLLYRENNTSFRSVHIVTATNMNITIVCFCCCTKSDCDTQRHCSLSSDDDLEWLNEKFVNCIITIVHSFQLARQLNASNVLLLCLKSKHHHRKLQDLFLARLSHKFKLIVSTNESMIIILQKNMTFSMCENKNVCMSSLAVANKNYEPAHITSLLQPAALNNSISSWWQKNSNKNNVSASNCFHSEPLEQKTVGANWNEEYSFKQISNSTRFSGSSLLSPVKKRSRFQIVLGQ